MGNAGCLGGSCGVRRQMHVTVDTVQGDAPLPGSPDCPVCDEGRYRLLMRTMLNPWARGGARYSPYPNAGANPTSGGDYGGGSYGTLDPSTGRPWAPGSAGYGGGAGEVGTINPATGLPWAGSQTEFGNKQQSQGGGAGGAVDYTTLLNTGLTQGAAIVRQQMAADAARADQAARDAAETARRTADAARQAGVQSRTLGIESASSGGGMGQTILLLGLALGGAVAAGVVKLPKGLGG